MPLHVTAGATAHAAGRIRKLGNLITHDTFSLVVGWIRFCVRMNRNSVFQLHFVASEFRSESCRQNGTKRFGCYLILRANESSFVASEFRSEESSRVVFRATTLSPRSRTLCRARSAKALSTVHLASRTGMQRLASFGLLNWEGVTNSLQSG
jgi:hypothetical protein